MRILVVDDSRRIRRYLATLVARIGEVEQAADGQVALDMVRASLDADVPYQLILMDIGMPGLNGVAALEAIRTLEGERQVRKGEGARVVMVTAMVEPHYILSAFRAQCEAFLPKPFTEDQLWEVLRDVGIEVSQAA